MVRKSKPYKYYPKEFKLEALRLVEESDRPASEIARQLGIRRNLLYKWKEQMAQSSDIGTRKRARPKKDEQSENAKLKWELKRLKEEKENLKKGRCRFK